MKKINKITLYIVLLIITSSCSLDIPLEDQVSDPDAVTTIVAAEKLLASAYKSYSNYNNILEFTLMSDDFQPTQLLKEDTNLKWIYTWNEYGIVPLAKSEWDGNYATIMNCNALLERLPNIQTATNNEILQLQQIKNRTIRLKAFCYLRLLKLFSSNVDNNDSSSNMGFIIKDKVEKTESGRVTIDESITYIKNLLGQASPTGLNGNIDYMSKNASEYLKADLAMWQGNYEEVIEIIKPLYENIGNSAFSQIQFSNLWNNIPSNAQIFSINISNRTGVYFYNNLLSSNLKDDYAVVNTKINYTNTDVRNAIYSELATMYVSIAEQQKEVMRFGKYCRLNRVYSPAKYVENYRAAGIVFLLAEAYAQNNNINEATTVLNTFLTARKATLVNENSSKNDLLTIISHEKQKEFIGEGERFFDLKRTLQNVQRYSQFNKKSNIIKITDYRWVFPIPAEEIRYNPACKQNKGWEHIK